MARRRPNPRLAKIHRSYTVEEIASLYGLHRNTVREWIKRGLPVCDDRRPQLVLGRDLAKFLETRRTRNRRPCQSGELYCVRCRAPRKPAGGMADYKPITATLGNLVAICPDCEALMHRRVSLAKLAPLRTAMDITMPEAEPHIVESGEASVNSDFAKETADHANAQPEQ